jgi:hypothetical protein
MIHDLRWVAWRLAVPITEWPAFCSVNSGRSWDASSHKSDLGKRMGSTRPAISSSSRLGGGGETPSRGRPVLTSEACGHEGIWCRACTRVMAEAEAAAAAASHEQARADEPPGIGSSRSSSRRWADGEAPDVPAGILRVLIRSAPSARPN